MRLLVRFVANKGSLISIGIRWRTDGAPSHTEFLILDDVDNPVSTFGARLSGGIKHRPYILNEFSFEEWYTFPGIEASYAEALKLEGRKYDWMDIVYLLCGWHPGYYNPMKGICSIAVGYSNRMAWGNNEAPALINPNVPTWQMTPQLLYGAVTQMIQKVK